MSKKLTTHAADVMDKLPHKDSSDPLVGFFYLLLRDQLSAGVVMELVISATEGSKECTFTNGHLVEFAEFCVEQLRGEADEDQD